MRCTDCSKEESVTLISGQKVCNYCPAWREECEARYLLGLPLHKRREQLFVRLKSRGEQGVSKLKEVMREIHARNRK